MIDFFMTTDPRLLFPNITESAASTIEIIANFIYLCSLILIIVAEWKLFKKFGEKPWKALIPFYNTYLLYKYTWKKFAFWSYIVSNFAFTICISVSKNLAQYSPDSDWVTIMVLIAVPFGIGMTICTILSAFRIAESFGKGKGFSVGLLLLYAVFVSILGFGKSKYITNNNDDAAIEVDESKVAESEEVV